MNRVYVFSDRFEALDLKRVALKLLTETLLSPSNQHAPYVEATKVAFENLPDGDPLLRLLADVHCEKYKYMDENNAEMEAQGLPHDFLVCLMMRYSKIELAQGNCSLISRTISLEVVLDRKSSICQLYLQILLVACLVEMSLDLLLFICFRS